MNSERFIKALNAGAAKLEISTHSQNIGTLLVDVRDAINQFLEEHRRTSRAIVTNTAMCSCTVNKWAIRITDDGGKSLGATVLEIEVWPDTAFTFTCTKEGKANLASSHNSISTLAERIEHILSTSDFICFLLSNTIEQTGKHDIGY